MRRLAAVAVAVVLATGTATGPALLGSVCRLAAAASARYPTDEPARRGVRVIRDLVATNHSLITHRRMPPDHALRFAAQVKIEADRILATSTMASEARERLWVLLAEVVAGIGAAAPRGAGSADPIEGLARADEALARYPKEFDDPSWVPLQSLD